MGFFTMWLAGEGVAAIDEDRRARRRRREHHRPAQTSDPRVADLPPRTRVGDAPTQSQIDYVIDLLRTRVMPGAAWIDSEERERQAWGLIHRGELDADTASMLIDLLKGQPRKGGMPLDGAPYRSDGKGGRRRA